MIKGHNLLLWWRRQDYDWSREISDRKGFDRCLLKIEQIVFTFLVFECIHQKLSVPNHAPVVLNERCAHVQYNFKLASKLTFTSRTFAKLRVVKPAFSVSCSVSTALPGRGANWQTSFYQSPQSCSVTYTPLYSNPGRETVHHRLPLLKEVWKSNKIVTSSPISCECLIYSTLPQRQNLL